jgi:hypothetical protein
VEVKGSNLSKPGDSRIWQTSEFANSQLPITLRWRQRDGSAARDPSSQTSASIAKNSWICGCVDLLKSATGPK